MSTGPLFNRPASCSRDTARPYLHPHFSFTLYSILDTPYSSFDPPDLVPSIHASLANWPTDQRVN